jgi:hypothetical protein
MSRSRRAVRWLQPGLVVKRWMVTSGLGLLLALLGGAAWLDLKPIYWSLESINWLLKNITTVMPRGITGPVVLVVGGGLIWLGQSRSFGSIQQALAPKRTRFWWMPCWPRASSTAAPTSLPSAAAPASRPCSRA